MFYHHSLPHQDIRQVYVVDRESMSIASNAMSVACGKEWMNSEEEGHHQQMGALFVRIEWQ